MPSLFGAIREVVTGITGGLLTGFNPGATPTGDPVADSAAAGAAIRAVTTGEYTLYVFTASDAAWAVPPTLANAQEAWAGVIGGSSRPIMGPTLENVENKTIEGGPGGDHGGYIVNPFDPSTLGSTLAIAIGVGASSVNTTGTASSIVNGATTLALSIPGITGVAYAQADFNATSAPGNGGRGGSATVPASTDGGSVTAGEKGGSTTAAAGGAGGSASSGNGSGTAGSGSAGSVGRTDAYPIRGGSGGGGGGGCSRYGGNATGGNGGNGAYPGGGPGGGGAAVSNGTIYSQTGGTPGATANGIAWILCRG